MSDDTRHNEEDDGIFGSTNSWSDDKQQNVREKVDVDGIGKQVETNYDDEEDDSFGKGGNGNGNGKGISRDGSVDQEDWLGTGLLESKMSMGGNSNGNSNGNSYGSAGSLQRNNSMHRTQSALLEVNSFLREKADDYEQSFVSTFNKKNAGKPPVSRQPYSLSRNGEEEEEDESNPFASDNPFASSSDMFETSF